MSITTDRAAIRAALTTATVVKAATNGVPAQLTSGSAWVQWDGMDPQTPGAPTNDWVVWYVLGQDLSLAEDRMSDVVESLRAALARELSISRIEPASVSQGGATVLVLQLTGRREHV